MVQPWLRFHIPLIEPDRRISRIRLSDKACVIWIFPLRRQRRLAHGGAGQPARHPARLTDLTPAGESVYAPVRAGMEDARAGAKPRLSHRDVPWVKAGSLVREPDAGNVHVRFDERDVKTEPRSNH